MLIDADPQANATSGIGILTKNEAYSIVNLFEGDIKTQLCVLDTHSPNLKIIPGSIKLAEIEINNKHQNLNQLKTALETVKNELDFIIYIVGVLIFAGLTAYDTQKIKNMYLAGDNNEVSGKKSVLGALTLYLDFILMFQFLLMFLGNRE